MNKAIHYNIIYITKLLSIPQQKSISKMQAEWAMVWSDNGILCDYKNCMTVVTSSTSYR